MLHICIAWNRNLVFSSKFKIYLQRHQCSSFFHHIFRPKLTKLWICFVNNTTKQNCYLNLSSKSRNLIKQANDDIINKFDISSFTIKKIKYINALTLHKNLEIHFGTYLLFSNPDYCIVIKKLSITTSAVWSSGYRLWLVGTRFRVRIPVHDQLNSTFLHYCNVNSFAVKLAVVNFRISISSNISIMA